MISFNTFPKGHFFEQLVCTLEVVVDDDHVVGSLLCIFDFLECDVEAFGDRGLGLGAATDETGTEVGESGRGEEAVDGVEIGLLDLTNTLQERLNGAEISSDR